MKNLERPLRTCLGCRTRQSQAHLRRLALISEPGDRARVVWDRGRTLGGRGAWLCVAKPDCLEQALRKNVLLRAFRQGGELDVSALTGPVKAAGQSGLPPVDIDSAVEVKFPKRP